VAIRVWKIIPVPAVLTDSSCARSTGLAIEFVESLDEIPERTRRKNVSSWQGNSSHLPPPLSETVRNAEQ
jgi:hypothetical protein